MKFLILITTFLSYGIIFAQTISTEAPSVSASGVNVDRNALQFETSFDVSFNNDYLPLKNTRYKLPFVLIRYGILDKLEVRATSSFLYTNTNTGSERYTINDLGLGLKYELLNTDKNTSLAIIGHYHMNKFIDWDHHATGTLAFGQGIGEYHSLGANLGFQYNRYPGVFNHSSYNTFGSLVYTVSFFEKWAAFAEVYGINYRAFKRHIWI